MDPFNIFQLFPEKLNSNKANLNKYSRFGKMATLYIQKPEAVILGSSRSEYGLSAYYLQKLTGLDSYNAALSGANAYEVLRTFQQAAQNDLKLAVIGLDLFMFNLYRKDSLNEVQMFSITSENETNTSYEYTLLSTALLSWTATSSSIRSLRKSKRLPSYLLDGQRNEASRIERITTRKGYNDAFKEIEQSFFEFEWFPCGKLNEGFTLGHEENSRIPLLKKIIEISAEKNIRLVFIISPTHARLLEAMSVAGLWGDFELWKTQLAKILSTSPPTQQIELWDFSGYSNYHTEPLPDESDKSPMQWHMEASHYTSALGHLVLDRVFSNSQETDFGTKITQDNIVEHLSKVRHDQSLWRKHHPDWRSELEEIFFVSKRKSGNRTPCPKI